MEHKQLNIGPYQLEWRIQRLDGGPSLRKLATNFSRAIVKWQKAGYPVVSKQEFHHRLGLCRGCEHWDEGGWFGLHKCAACGCSGLKLWLETEQCPLLRWNPVNGEEPVPSTPVKTAKPCGEVKQDQEALSKAAGFAGMTVPTAGMSPEQLAAWAREQQQRAMDKIRAEHPDVQFNIPEVVTPPAVPAGIATAESVERHNARIQERLNILKQDGIEAEEHDGKILITKIPPEETAALKFFNLLEPCFFEGCEELRTEYQAGLEKAGGEKCTSCAKGRLIREFKPRVKQAILAQKEKAGE